MCAQPATIALMEQVLKYVLKDIIAPLELVLRLFHVLLVG